MNELPGLGNRAQCVIIEDKEPGRWGDVYMIGIQCETIEGAAINISSTLEDEITFSISGGGVTLRQLEMPKADMFREVRLLLGVELNCDKGLPMEGV